MSDPVLPPSSDTPTPEPVATLPPAPAIPVVDAANVANVSSYGVPPSTEELHTAEQKAEEFVQVQKKPSLGMAVKVGGGVLALVLLMGGIMAGTGLVQLPFGTIDTASKAADHNKIDGECPDGRKAGSCIVYECTNDTNKDGQCNPADDEGGHVIKEGSSDNCQYTGSCGQADIYTDDGSFCGTQGHDISGCGGGGGGGGGGGEPCTEEETCSDGKTVCKADEDCILRDTETNQWGCRKAKECKEVDTAGILCDGLDSSKAAPTIGEAVTLTCKSKGSKKVDHFEFRYRVEKGNWVGLDSGTAQGVEGKDKQFTGTSQLTVSQSGSHQVQCRVCKKADGNCTNWGKKS